MIEPSVQPRMKEHSQRKAGSIRRTRSGCWNCKERRRRCTEERPSCSGCAKRGLQCHYGMRLLWQDEAESMGIAFGRAGMNDRFRKDKKKPNVSHYLLPACSQEIYYWLNTTWEDVQWLYDVLPTIRWTLHGGDTTTDSTIPIPPTVSQNSSLGQTDGFLFHYFSNVCTLRRSLVEDQNPWQKVIIPLCYQSQGLLHAAIAWAAHDLRNQHRKQGIFQSIDMDQMVLQHKYRSLKYLRNMVPQQSLDVESMSLAQTQTERDSLLLLVMLHCILEIASGSIMEWTFHMRGALLIMKFYSELRGPSRGVDAFSPQVLELVYGFFAEKDIFLATTGNEGEEFNSLQWSTEVQSMFPFLSGLSMKIHPCMGVSPELLDIISSITTLARRPLGAEGNSLGTRDHFDILRQRLQQSQSLPERLQLTGLINLHAAAFEEAAWIYLHHAVHDQTRRQGDAIHEVHLPKLFDILQQIHAIQGELLGFIPYPMWALFIASCSVSSDEERVKILEWFTILKCNKPISNVPSTMAAVEAIWKRRDLEPDDGYSRSLQNSLNWRAAVSQLGWKMPLT